MRASTNKEQSTWRDYWAVKFILAEIPLIGGFFKTGKPGHIAHHAVKSSFMLLGGTTVMMLNLLSVSEADSPGEKFAKMTGGMAIGMTGGTVLYNTIFSIGKKTLNTAKKCCQSEEDEEQKRRLIDSPTVNV